MDRPSSRSLAFKLERLPTPEMGCRKTHLCPKVFAGDGTERGDVPVWVSKMLG